MAKMHYWVRKFSEAKGDGAIDLWFEKWVQTAGQHYSYPTIARDGREFVPSEPGLYLWGADGTVNGKQGIVPRYVGKDDNSLRSRLLSGSGRHSGGRGRYVLPLGVRSGDAPPQGWLAIEYYEEIRAAVGKTADGEYADTLKPFAAQSPAVRGLNAFPKSVVARVREKIGSDLRLRHAVDWALHGGPNLERLWVALLPLPGIAKPDLKKREADLRGAAIRWRIRHGLPPLLSSQDR